MSKNAESDKYGYSGYDIGSDTLPNGQLRKSLLYLVLPIVFLFLSGFSFLRNIHSITGEVGGSLFNSSLTIPPLSQTLRY